MNWAMRGSPLRRATSAGSAAAGRGSFVQPGRGRELDARFAERRQHLVDVAQKGRVGADHEHPLHLEREAVRIQEISGTVERHGRLAGPRPTLDDQSARSGEHG